jgi:hypothetical protein
VNSCGDPLNSSSISASSKSFNASAQVTVAIFGVSLSDSGDTLYGAAATPATVWQYSLPPWFNVTTSSSNVKAFDSTNLTNGADTTQQIGAGTFITDNNGVSEDGSGGPTNFAGSDEAEYEYTVEFISADLAEGDTVYFRLA